MTKKAIIFGAAGQDGQYLSTLLTKNHIEVIGISRSGNYLNGSVTDYVFVEALLKKHMPDYIFHFAANSTTRHDALFENHETISTGTLNILEAAKIHCPKSKIFLSGSAMQFENKGLPINESTPFEASSSYSVARIQSVYAGRYYREKFGIKVYVGYFFNHDSPLRKENHVNQKIIRCVQRISQGSNERLVLGNIDVQKEFGFAGDIVEAVFTMINQNEIFEVIIGTGKVYSIKDWLVTSFEKVGKDWKDHVIINHDYKPEYQILISEPNVINRLGWRPKTTFEKLFNLMFEKNE